jgi:hypothetical protein
MEALIFMALGFLALGVRLWEVRAERREHEAKCREKWNGWAEPLILRWRQSGFWVKVERDERGYIRRISAAREKDGELLMTEEA